MQNITKMKKHILLIITLLLLSPCIFAQQVIISGKVTSIEDDTGIPGVTVSIKNRASGTITDINGDYTISANRGEVLKFSYMGFNTREVTVGSSNVINIVLSPSVSQLDEVVVTALGVKRQKREVGYTIESVPAKELQLSNAGNLASALSGRSAGEIGRAHV